MAESKKPEPKKDESSLAITYLPLWVGLACLIVISWIMQVPIFEDPVTVLKEDVSTRIDNEEEDFTIYKWIGIGKLQEGNKIINVKKTSVRNNPAGSILGAQKKLETGLIKGEPLEQYGTFWVQVDYPDAPDGWVEINSISSKITTVRLLNIIPLTYGMYKPIGYGLLILFFFLYIYIRILLKKEKNIWKEKNKLKDEQYRQKTGQVPLNLQIKQKPDVEELPGFQTEEIIPIEELEKQNRWQHIQDLIKSYNPSDWRQAIIEADIILEEMLDKMGYEGVTIGDKLKKIERSDFITLDKAWSAHKVRNQIAHDGSSFKLTRELAEKTIKEFEEVFREFYYI